MGKLLDSSWHGAFESLPIELVVSSDFQVLDTGEHIELCDVERVETIDLVSVLNNVQVQPSTLTLAACSGTKFLADLLNAITDFVVEPSREGPGTNSCRVGFHNTDSRLNSLGRNTKTSEDTTNTGVAGSDIGVSTEVNIEHGRVGSFSNNALIAISECLVHEVNTVNNHAVFRTIESLVQLAELVEFFLLIKVAQRELLLKYLNKSVVLFEESSPICHITDSKTHAEGLGSIGWTDTLVGSSEDLNCAFSSTSLFLRTISLNLNVGD